MSTLRFGPYTVETHNEDKVLFPGDGITKRDLLDYYVEIADHLLPHVRERPVTLERYPGGVGEDGFFQKDAPEYFPDWIETVRVRREGGSLDHVICGNQASLAYLADQACITPHVWLSRKDQPDVPDRMVFDLDPPDDDFDVVRAAARAVRDVLGELELPAFLTTTGSRGVHVVVPLRREEGFDEVRSFTREVAALVAARDDRRFTTEVRKDARKGRLYLDVARNAYAQTVAPPYSVRAREGAPVATPIEWDELGDVDARVGTLRTVRERLEKHGDPWKHLARRARSLDRARKALESLGS